MVDRGLGSSGNSNYSPGGYGAFSRFSGFTRSGGYPNGGDQGGGGIDRNRMGQVVPRQAIPTAPVVAPAPAPAYAPPTPQVPAPNPLTQGWSSLPMGPPQTVPAFNPSAGWNSLPMGPPQTTPAFVQPRSVPVTNMPNTSYPTYNPNSPVGMFQGALSASNRLGGQGGGGRTSGGFGR